MKSSSPPSRAEWARPRPAYLAAIAAEAGCSVVLVDADAQASAADWIENSGDAGRLHRARRGPDRAIMTRASSGPTTTR
jgi:hypothetical protein